jgi:hypothetical protein
MHNASDFRVNRSGGVGVKPERAHPPTAPAESDRRAGDLPAICSSSYITTTVSAFFSEMNRDRAADASAADERDVVL